MDISNIPKRIKAIYDLNKRKEELPEGSSEKVICEFENSFGKKFDERLRLLYLTLDGTGECYLGNHIEFNMDENEVSLFSLISIETRLLFFPYDDFPYFNNLNSKIWKTAVEIDPSSMENGSKLMFAYCDKYEYFYDYAPSDMGTIGQIIAFGEDQIKFLSKDLDSFLESLITGFELKNDILKPFELQKRPFTKRIVFKFLKEDNLVIFKRYVEEGLDIKLPIYDDYNVHYWAVKNKSKNILTHIYDKKLLSLNDIFINAVELESKALMQTCIDKGLKVNFLPKGGGRLPLSRILSIDSEFVFNAIDFLLENGAEINKLDTKGATPYEYGHILLDMQNIEFNRVLINKFIDYLESKGGKFSFKL